MNLTFFELATGKVAYNYNFYLDFFSFTTCNAFVTSIPRYLQNFQTVNTYKLLLSFIPLILAISRFDLKT